MSQNERLQELQKLVKERPDEITDLTNETNVNDLIYYFKGNTTREKLIISKMGLKTFANFFKT